MSVSEDRECVRERGREACWHLREHRRRPVALALKRTREAKVRNLRDHTHSNHSDVSPCKER
eukprot:6184811-Pleurochrysis_carterae.AAC.1